MNKIDRLKLCRLIALIFTSLLVCTSCQKVRKPSAVSDFHKPDNVILISIDTLRADHLGVYGYDKPISPNIDRFAKGAVIYEHAYSSSNWTVPGHAGILTGLMSSAHRGITHRDAISAKVPLVSETIQKAGMSTGAFVSHIFVSEKYGFNRGFDQLFYKELAKASEITEMAISWIDGLKKPKGFFIFLHYFDVHTPYGRDKSYNERFAPDCPYPVTWAKTVEMAIAGDWTKFQCFQKLYDADIAYVDEHVGRFIKFLKRRNLYDNSLIMLTSDHGELFGEHGAAGHGLTLFEEEIAVPLIIKWPGNALVRSTVQSPVSNIQIAPTIIEALGIETFPTDLPSLMHREVNEGVYPDWIASETRKTGPDQIAVIKGRKKVILPPTYGIQGLKLSPRYFDLDRGEDTDLWMKNPGEAKKLALSAANSGWYGNALCYEVTYSPETANDSVTIEFDLPTEINAKTISSTNKVFAQDGSKFRTFDIPISERGDTKIVILTAQEHRRGFTMILDPPNTPVTFRIASIRSKGKLPVFVGNTKQAFTEKAVTIQAPTGDINLPGDLPKHYLLIRSYEVLHLERPNAAPSEKAKKMSKEQIEMLRSLGYVGM